MCELRAHSGGPVWPHLTGSHVEKHFGRDQLFREPVPLLVLAASDCTAMERSRPSKETSLLGRGAGTGVSTRDWERAAGRGAHTENRVHGGSLRPSVGPSSRLSLPLCTRSSGPCWTCSGVLLDMLLGQPQLSGQPGSRRRADALLQMSDTVLPAVTGSLWSHTHISCVPERRPWFAQD